MTPDEHRELGKELFNRAWELLELEARTPEEDDELIDAAHGSRFQWGEGGGEDREILAADLATL
jgi:hypothetical protein